MVYYGFDYVAQIGTVILSLFMCAFLLWIFKRVLKPLFERVGMVERVKMAAYDIALEQYCKDNKIDYSKIDVDLTACYKKKNNKLKERLEEIENSL